MFRGWMAALLLGLALAFNPGAAGAQTERQGDDPLAYARAWIEPTEGPTGTVVILNALGLAPDAAVPIWAGPDPDSLFLMDEAVADRRGQFTVELRVPGDAEYGEDYHFAIQPDEDTLILAEEPFRVRAREGRPIGGA
jgi:hypothetical protein